MKDIKFSLDEIDKTFTKYKKHEIFDGVVVIKKDSGVIFNIGGKKDAFIEKADFANYDSVKIGDSFKVAMLGTKNEDDMVLVSKTMADEIIASCQEVEKLKLGSKITFVATAFRNGNLVSKLGIYNIVVPKDEIDIVYRHFNFYLNKQHTAVVTSIDAEQKLIVCSIKVLKEQVYEAQSQLFWQGIFINKIVSGVVEKILPYGAFVNVDGITCFIHISDLAYKRVENVADYLTVGEKYDFRIIKIDRDEKRVSLGLKQLEENPKLKVLKALNQFEVVKGVVVKYLAFGAIVKLNDFDIDGLLHISNATEDKDKRIYEIVKLDEEVNVEILDIDLEKQKLSLKLVK